MAEAVIVPASNIDIASYYGGIEFTTKWVARVMRRGKLIAAAGGAFEAKEGVWYGFLDVPAHERRRVLYRYARKVIEEARFLGAKEIRATCDLRIPRAQEFMERLGFMPTNETIDGKEVWHVRL